MVQVCPQSQQQQEAYIVSGNALFKHNQQTINKSFQILLQSQTIRYVLSQKNWHIKLGDYSTYDWKAAFKQMKESSVQRIFAYGNLNPILIKQIRNVNFINLVHLDLGGNNINNIEPLTQMNFQKLEHLSLGSNHIFRVKSLNKLALQFLDFMDLDNNPLSQIDFVNILLRKTKKQDLYLFIGNQKKQAAYQLQDLSVIVKLGEVQIHNAQNTKHIVLNECQRINQFKVQKMLKSKFIQQAVHYMKYRA